ncbi:MAG: DMT family transporter [Alphaproteobacteria bacterium]|jgi:drug/metabolite transporter (DMT)-like permease|nr:DMT family transporter [Alphaproteobacteria bacterium]MBT4083469.1 DMT family transporter [Alphaproteobacteria bacterium]MBT4545774.1 DMT family transporter [Alphaproteobacteria bacterium]
MLLLVMTGAMFSCMHGTIRFITGGATSVEGLHPFEIAFFRNFFGLVVLLPLIFRAGFRSLRTTKFKFHFWRSLLQVSSMLMFFSALKLSALADVTALSFLAPLFTTIGAILFLGEKAKIRRWIALIIGFAGALIILRPGFQEMNLGLVLVLTSSAIWGGTMLIIKSLARTESSVSIAIYMAILMTPMSLIPAMFYWRMPTGEEFAGLFVVGLLGTLGHLMLAQAFKEADASAILPLDFTKLIFASIVGYILFSEVPGIWTWIGGGLIFSSATYVAYRESKQA